jgi:hypothetical protein
VVSTAFIRDFLIGEADIASFSCYSKPPASAGGAFTYRNKEFFKLGAAMPLMAFTKEFSCLGVECSNNNPLH